MSETPYGAQPYPTGPGFPEPATVERPQSIRLAVIGMYVGAGLSVLGIAVQLLLVEDIDRASFEAAADAGIDVGVIRAIAMAVLIVVGLLSAALWIWMAIANGAGRSWARIVATVFGGIAIVTGPFSLVGVTALELVVNGLSLALAIGILVLLWRPESSAYYRARSQHPAR